jgi:hypothetical protein
MNIPTELHDKWKKLYSRGDAHKISVTAGVHYNTVLNAIKSGKCRTDLMEAIGNFFNEKEQKINQLS